MFDSNITLDPILPESVYAEKTLKYVNIVNIAFLFFFIFGVLTPLSSIFQLYHGDQF